MTPRAFLIRGLLAGLLAGIATFFVTYTVGEPSVERAIAIEHATDQRTSETAITMHADQMGTEVSRATQSTWGLLTGTVTVGVALGGVVSLVAAAVAGRVGRLGVGATTALVTSIGFGCVALVPFLKYPSNPPAVGNAETIGTRTALYFGFVLVSVAAAVTAAAVAHRVARRHGAYAAVLTGALGYLVVMVVAGLLFPTVNEVGAFPADTLWFFRRATLFTVATLWGVIGVALTGLLLRLQDRPVSPVGGRLVQPAR